MEIKTSNENSYGILLSGGLDSAVLLYLLVKSNPSINLQAFTIPKSDGAMLYANPVIHHINKKFNLSLSDTISVGDPTVYHRLQSTTAVKDIFQKYSVDFLFVAINQNPPELNDLPNAPKRDSKPTHPKVIFPFISMLKDEILQILYNEKQEDLIDITHTCTEQIHHRCNICWQCSERIWAFKQLNKIDTGIL